MSQNEYNVQAGTTDSQYLLTPQANNEAPRGSLVTELYQDVIGSLFPGMIVVILCSNLIFINVFVFYLFLFEVTSNSIDESTQYITSIMSSFHLEIAVLYIATSFIVGTILSRLDINIPSSISAFASFAKGNQNDKKNSAVSIHVKYNEEAVRELTNFGFNVQKIGGQVTILRERMFSKKFFQQLRGKICRFLRYKRFHQEIQKILHIKFPFIALRCALYCRGKQDLYTIIPWCPKNEKTFENCSKVFINDAKTVIAIKNPYAYNIINKSEAQIKLVNSAWYSLRIILCTVLLTLIFSVIHLMMYIAVSKGLFHAPIINSLIIKKSIFMEVVVSSALFVLCAICYRYVTNIIYSMRKREIIQILSFRKELISDNANKPKISFGCATCDKFINMVRNV